MSSVIQFYPPLIAAEEVTEGLDRLATVEDAGRLWAAVGAYRFVPVVSQAVQICDPPRGIEKPSFACLFIQQGANVHANPDFMVLTFLESETRRMRAVACDNASFVLPAAGPKGMGFADIYLEGEEETRGIRLLGDTGAFDSRAVLTSVTTGDIGGVMHYYLDLMRDFVRPEFRHSCNTVRLKGFTTGTKFQGSSFSCG